MRRCAQPPRAPPAAPAPLLRPRPPHPRLRCRAGSFEAHADPAQAVVLASCVGLAAVWWLSVVPSERRALGRLKRARGSDLRGYLDALDGVRPRCYCGRGGALADIPLEKRLFGRKHRTHARPSTLQDASRPLQRWFYADWLRARWFTRGRPATRGADEAAAASSRANAAGASSAAAGDAGPPGAPPPPPPAEVADVEPAFLSLDNPVVFTFAVLAALAAAAALGRGSGLTT